MPFLKPKEMRYQQPYFKVFLQAKASKLRFNNRVDAVNKTSRIFDEFFKDGKIFTICKFKR